MQVDENNDINSNPEGESPGPIGVTVPFPGYEDDLQRVLEKDQLELHLQPIISLGKWAWYGVEVLLRWKHPQHGLILPEYVIPGLEKSGMWHDAGRWILHEACKLNRLWQGQSQTPRIFINVSHSQLIHGDFIHTLDATLQDAGLSPNCLVLELSEDCAAESNLLKQLREKDISLALNYSGEDLLGPDGIDKLPINIIKLDKTLIHQISHHQDKRVIMATISSFAHEHGLEIIAEGVETAEQLLFVNALCCSAAQGFLLAHPMAITEFEAFYHSDTSFEYLVEKCRHTWTRR